MQVEGGSRRRHQPAPPHVIFEALTNPYRDPAPPRLILLDDEQQPAVIAAEEPHRVVWSSLWSRRPDATLQFDLAAHESRQGCDLRWTLLLNEPLPDDALLGHMRKRVNQLINANLRYSFGQ